MTTTSPEARKALEEASLPFPLSGARFVPAERVQEIDAGLQALRSEFEDLTRIFAFEYPEIRSSVRPTLIEAAAEVWMSVAKNGVTREDFERAFLARIESAYPDPRELARRFSFRWKFFAITAPKNGTLVPESAVEAAERARVRDDVKRRAVASEEAEVREAISNMAQDLRDQFRAPDIGQELLGLYGCLGRLQHQLELGCGVADLQVVEHGAQGGQGTVVPRGRHAVQAHDEGSLLVVGE